MFKVNKRNTRTRCEICSKVTIKTPERRQWRCSGTFIVNFEKVNTDWVATQFPPAFFIRSIIRLVQIRVLSHVFAKATFHERQSTQI